MRATLLVVFLFVLTSCRTFNGEAYRVDKPWWDSTTERPSAEDLKDLQIDLATFCFEEDRTYLMKDETSRNAGNQSDAKQLVVTDASGRQFTCKETAYRKAQRSAIARDRFQELLMRESDRECDGHKASVIGTNAGFNLALGGLASLLSGAASVIVPTTTKGAFSAASGVLMSGKAQFNEQVYRQVFVGTLVKAIEDARRELELEIIDRRLYRLPMEITNYRRTPAGRMMLFTDSSAPTTSGSAQTTSPTAPPIDPGAAPTTLLTFDSGRMTYSADEAIRDAQRYHERCSFYYGLVRVAETVEAYSPCRRLEERRDRLYAELDAPGIKGTPREKDYLKELESLRPKLEECQKPKASG